jgi:hypothetical protein
VRETEREWRCREAADRRPLWYTQLGVFKTPADPDIPPEGEPSGIVRGKHRETQ